jgi:hypothetical protein
MSRFRVCPKNSGVGSMSGTQWRSRGFSRNYPLEGFVVNLNGSTPPIITAEYPWSDHEAVRTALERRLRRKGNR